MQSAIIRYGLFDYIIFPRLSTVMRNICFAVFSQDFFSRDLYRLILQLLSLERLRERDDLRPNRPNSPDEDQTVPRSPDDVLNNARNVRGSVCWVRTRDHNKIDTLSRWQTTYDMIRMESKPMWMTQTTFFRSII